MRALLIEIRDLLLEIRTLLHESRELQHEILDRPRPTVVHLSAYSRVQLERLARVLVDVVRKVMRGQ